MYPILFHKITNSCLLNISVTPTKPGSKRPYENKETTSERSKELDIKSKKAKKQAPPNNRDGNVTDGTPSRSSGRKAAIEGRAKIKSLATDRENQEDIEDDSDRDENYAGSVSASDTDDNTSAISEEDSDYVPDVSSNSRSSRNRQKMSSSKKLSPVVRLRQLSPKDMMKWTKDLSKNNKLSEERSNDTTKGMGKKSQSALVQQTGRNHSKASVSKSHNTESVKKTTSKEQSMESRVEILSMGKI